MKTKTTSCHDVVMELQGIQHEMLELVSRAKCLLKDGGFEGALSRAQSYWMAHIICAAGNDHSYLGRSMVSLQDTIEEIENSGDE